MNAFIYRDELYIRCIPGKNLFKSTMVHEVVNRGDIFAIRVSDSSLTIIPGTTEVEHQTVLVMADAKQIAKEMKHGNRKKAAAIASGETPNLW